MVANGGVNPFCRDLKDHSNTVVEISLREAYEIEEFILLTGPDKGGMGCPEGHAKPPRSLKFGNGHGKSRARLTGPPHTSQNGHH